MSFGLQGPESLIGRVIAGYELTSFLGTGATGLVFRGKRVAGAPAVVEKTGAVPVLFPEDAAIKLLVLPLGTQPEEQADFQRRFEREADVLRQLAHPHIVPFIDSGKDAGSGFYYMVLEYMAGGSLATSIAQRGPLPLTEVAALLTPIAEALDFAHSRGVVHRDVKPGNILLDGQGAPYLGDFGIVRLLSDNATQRTTTGRMMGTPAYMAPEQFDDSSKVGSTADVYGLGMVVYEMITGRAAFSATSWAQVMKQQLQETPVFPRTLRPDLPEPAEMAILRALEKNPAQRFPTAAAFAQAFALGMQNLPWAGMTRFVAPDANAFVSGSAAWTQPNPQAARFASAPPRRASWGVLIVGVALLLIVACLAALALPGGGGSLIAQFLTGAKPRGTSLLSTATLGQTVSPGGNTPTGVHPTATSRDGGGNPTATPIGAATATDTPIGAPTATDTPLPTLTPSPTPTDTPPPTATPVPPTATPCPYLNGGVGVIFYDQQNYTGNSYTLWVAPGQVNTVVNLPSPIAGHLNSIQDTNQAWTIVVYQNQNGSGNLGFFYSSQPTITSYWQATQSVKVYVNRSC